MEKGKRLPVKLKYFLRCVWVYFKIFIIYIEITKHELNAWKEERVLDFSYLQIFSLFSSVSIYLTNFITLKQSTPSRQLFIATFFTLQRKTEINFLKLLCRRGTLKKLEPIIHRNKIEKAQNFLSRAIFTLTFVGYILVLNFRTGN